MTVRLTTTLAAIVAVALLAACSGDTDDDAAPIRVGSPAPPETVTVEVAPQACVDAVDYAVEFADAAIRHIDITAPYPQMVVDAAVAGAALDDGEIARLTDDLDTITAQLNILADDIDAMVPGWRTARDECLAAADPGA